MSPRTEEQNALLKDERREHILSAALRVFAMRGFAATKIKDIAAKGNISHGLVYHYFQSKEDIFFELVSRALHVAGESLMYVDAMPLSPLEKVRETARFILGSIEQGQESSCYFMIVLHASVMEISEEEKNRVFKGGDVPALTLSKILAEGQKQGEIKEGDVYGMTSVFFAAITGLAVNKLGFPGMKMPDPEILVQMVMK